MFYPRVRHAANLFFSTHQGRCQLCTDLEEIIQKRYHQQLSSVFIPTLEDPEYTHMPWCFCEGVVLDTLVSYLTSTPSSHDICALSTLQMINHRYDGITITTSAMAADARESMFAKHYLVIMALLSNVLRNAKNAKRDHQFLKIKTMECASLVAIAGWETNGRWQDDGYQDKACALEENCQASETLLIYCSTLRAKYTLDVLQTLESGIPCLEFNFHEGFWEASAIYFTDSLLVIDGRFNFPQEYRYGIIDATKHQRQVVDKRKGRSIRLA